MAENLLDGKVAKLEKDIKYLRNLAINHYGDIGDDIHGTPNDGMAGFMPYDLYVGAGQAFRKRQWVTGMDIANLEPGYYYCAYMTGIPDDAEQQAMATIDVTVYEDNRKKIVYTQGFANVTWTKMIHVPGQTPDGRGWYKTAQIMSVWEGAMTSGTATLSRPRSDFKYLEYIYTGISSNAGSSKMLATMAYAGLDATNIPDIVDEEVIAHTEMGLRFSDQRTFKIETNHTMYVSPNSTGIDPDKSHVITLRGIIGHQA